MKAYIKAIRDTTSGRVLFWRFAVIDNQFFPKNSASVNCPTWEVARDHFIALEKEWRGRSKYGIYSSAIGTMRSTVVVR